MYISPVIIGTAIEYGACGFITGIGHLSDLYDLSVELSWQTLDVPGSSFLILPYLQLKCQTLFPGKRHGPRNYSIKLLGWLVASSLSSSLRLTSKGKRTFAHLQTMSWHAQITLAWFQTGQQGSNETPREGEEKKRRCSGFMLINYRLIDYRQIWQSLELCGCITLYLRTNGYWYPCLVHILDILGEPAL